MPAVSLSPPLYQRRFWALLALAYFLLSLVTFAPALGTSHFVFGTDTYSHDYIMHLYGWREIGDNGRLPLWCPHLFCGLPFIGSLALCPFYPSQLLYFVLPHNAAFTLQYALALWVAALTFAVWMRQIGLSRGITFWAGVAVIFSGHVFTLTYAGHLQKIIAIAWAPLAFAGVHGILRSLVSGAGQVFPGIAAEEKARRRLGAASGFAALSVALAMQLLASHPQIFYATVAVSFAYVAVLVFTFLVPAFHTPASPWLVLRIGLQPLFLMLLAIAFAFVISAVQSLPAHEMARVSNRAGGVTFAEATETSYPPLELGEYVIPRMFGDSVRETETPYFGKWGERIVSDYLGIPVIVLAIVALLLSPSRHRFFFLFLVITGWILGLGAYTPLYRLFFRLVPGFDSFRSPGTFMFLTNFGLIGLAALGLQALLDRSRQPELPPDVQTAPPQKMSPPEAVRYIFARSERQRVLGALLMALASASLAIMLVALIRTAGNDAEPGDPAWRNLHVYRRLVLLGIETFLTALLLQAVLSRVLRKFWPQIAIATLRQAALAVFAAFAIFLLVLHNRHFLQFEPLETFDKFLLQMQRAYSFLNTTRERPLRMMDQRALKVDNILYDVGSPTGYHPIMLNGYANVLAAVGYDSRECSDLFFINYARTYDAQLPPGPWRVLRDISGQRLWKREVPLPNYTRPGIDITPTLDAADTLKKLNEKRWPLTQIAYVEKDALQRWNFPAGAQQVNAEQRSWSAHHIELRVSAAASPSNWLLPVAEPAAPGWKAEFEDGTPIRVAAVNHGQRALIIPGGKLGIVRMRYDPFSFRLGAYLSGVALALAVFRIIVGRRGKVEPSPVHLQQ